MNKYIIDTVDVKYVLCERTEIRGRYRLNWVLRVPCFLPQMNEYCNDFK